MNTSLTPLITRFNTRFALAAICILLLSAQARAATFTSAGTGNWDTPATWSVSGGNAASNIPTASDDVVIRLGDVVTLSAPATISSLTVTGGLVVNIPNGMLKTNNIEANPSATVGTIDVVAGNLRVEKLFKLTRLLVTVDGASSSVTYGEDKDFTRTNEYIQLKNSGKLILENIGKGAGSIKRQYNQGNILFPIGTTNGTTYAYTPVEVNNRDNRPATITAAVAVTVNNGVLTNGSDGSPISSNAVNRTWSVEVLSGDADLQVYYYWTQSNELPNFTAANSMVALFKSGAWDKIVPTTINAAARVVSLAGFSNIPPATVPVTPSPPTIFPLMSVQGSTPLPVELIAFNAVKKNNDVALTWETASEKNCKGFEVQASADGKNYDALDFVASHNSNASYSQRYAYTDRIAKKEGLMYYRLKQIDLDGTVAYSQAKVVDLGRFNYTASVYPNPFQDAFKVNLETQTAQTAEVLVTDITGKTLYNTETSLAKGNNTLDINLSNQTPGLYLLKVTTGTQTYINRLVKQ